MISSAFGSDNRGEFNGTSCQGNKYVSASDLCKTVEYFVHGEPDESLVDREIVRSTKNHKIVT